MSEDRFVYLQAGRVVPLAAVNAALNIERAGPVDRDDLAELRLWKPHVRMLLAYVADDRHLRNDGAPRRVQVGPIVVTTPRLW